MSNSIGGGLIRGLSDGISLGTQLIGAYEKNQAYNDQQEVKNVMAEGLASAKQARADDISANTQVGSKANADNTMTMPTFDDASGNSYANAEDQKKAAEKNAPLPEDFYIRDVVPKIRETYIAQGNMAGAEQWDKWAQDKNAQTGMKHWAQALRAGQMGDFKSYADNMVKAYNTPGYYDDGLHAEGYDLVKDKDGNTTGLTLKMKNKDTGESFAQTIHGQDDMVQAGIGLLDPANAFKTTLAQQTARQTAQAKVAFEGIKTQYGMQRDNNKEVVKASAASALENQKAGNAEEKVRLTKQLEASNKKQELELKQTAGLLFKKGASPQEAHRMLVQGMNTKFVDYAGKPTMTPEEMSTRATEMVEATYGKGSLANPMSGGLPGTTTTQAPPPAPAAAPGKRPVRLDMTTGQVVPL